MGVCVSRQSEESELAKQVLGSTKADAKTVRRLSALGVVEGEVWVTRQTSDIRKVFKFGPQINKGQFGTIHVITNAAGDKFACKQISKKKLAGLSSIRDIRREIEIMHHLRGHPHVITFHGAYEDANDVYMVMELCTGGDLFERIEKITTITERAAASLFRELVETVSYCHMLGVVHRDLKPENFLITDRGPTSRIKLADFGLSCFHQEDGGDLHDVVGSAYYMAPEVIRRSYGPACDTWSLGVILHILLTGAPPFTGSSDADILRAVRTQEVDLTAAPWPSISRHARHLASKMLEKDPDKRIRLDQVLSHPWLRPDGTAPPRALQGGLRDRILQFRALNTFKREARRVLAAALPPEEVSGLKLLFEALDADHDGLLSLEELREGLAKRGEEMPDADVRTLLKAVDLNSDGYIDYREFVAATCSLSRMQRQQVLMRAFRYFDLDGDGFITREELSSVLSSVPLPSPSFGSSGAGAGGGGPGGGGGGFPLPRESIAQLLAEADLDSDGRVDYREFCAMVLAATGDGGGEVDGGSDQQLVQPANLPGLVDEAAAQRGLGGAGGVSAKRRDKAGGTAEDDDSGGGTRRALSSGARGSISSSSRGGGGSTRGTPGGGGAAVGSRRPSQPSPALVAAPPPSQLAARASGVVHGTPVKASMGPGWAPLPNSAQEVALAGGPTAAGGGGYDSDAGGGAGGGDDSGSEDSVIEASRRGPPPQLQAPGYGEASVRNGVPRSGLVVVSER